MAAVRQTPLDRRSKRALHFRYLVDLVDDVPGTIVECGVGAGKSLQLLSALTAGTDRKLWAFDSFAGLPEPTAHDTVDAPRDIRAGKLAHTEQEVRQFLISYGARDAEIDRRIAFVPGFYPASFPEYDGSPIALLHLDVDLYRSYLDCLEFFEPLVAQGGVVAFDEYDRRNWPGATVAIDEYYGGSPAGMQKSPYWDRWYVVKDG